MTVFPSGRRPPVTSSRTLCSVGTSGMRTVVHGDVVHDEHYRRLDAHNKSDAFAHVITHSVREVRLLTGGIDSRMGRACLRIQGMWPRSTLRIYMTYGTTDYGPCCYTTLLHEEVPLV